jgi:NDP-sugar pyrophosphorylase family protein
MADTEMRAILLAGGKGTRLRPYTTVIPKPLVPVGEQAIMEILVRQLARHRCRHITVAVNHQAQLIMAYFGDGAKWGVRLDYSREDKPLGTIGPLKLVRDLPEHFLVMNGDILTDLDFGRFYAAHVASGAVATIATHRRSVKVDFGVLTVGERAQRIESFSEKPVEHFQVSMGVYAFSRKILDLVPGDEAFGFDDLMLTMIERGLDVRAYPYPGYWLDIGRPDDYDRANEEYSAVLGRLLPEAAEED